MIEVPVTISARAVSSSSPATISGNMTGLFSMAGDMASGVPAGTRGGDEAILNDIYADTGGATWTNNTGWGSGSVSLSDGPYGVRTETIGGELRVTGLQFNGSSTPEQTGSAGGNGLSGTLPDLSGLTECTYLNVMFNSLAGPLGDMPPNIEYMYLNNPSNDGYDDPHINSQSGSGVIHPSYDDDGASNKYNSDIPSSYEALSNLKWIWIPWAGITGNIPDLRAAGANLEGVNFWSNPFQNSPVPDMFQSTPNISHIILGRFNTGPTATYSGDFPNLSGLTKLIQLNMKRMGLHADEFPDLEQSVDIVEIFVAINDIQGDLPHYLLDGTLPRLLALYYYFNEITGTFPATIPRLFPLRVLVGAGNNMTGEIPDSLWENNDSIINTNFDDNNHSGSLKKDLTNQDRVRNLRLANNDVSGDWPTFAWGTTDADDFSYVSFNGNRFVFSNMLWIPTEFNPESKTIFELYSEHVPNPSRFTYGNQQRFGSPDDVTAGIIDFSSVVTHVDNVYVWEKDGNVVVGETTAIIDTSEYGVGEYELIVTNPNISDLTLRSILII